MKKISIIIIFICIACYQWLIGNNTTAIAKNSDQKIVSSKTHNTNDVIEHAYNNRQSNVQVVGTGTVIKVLRDDNEGSRHQKFILRLSSGQTLVVAHNIDLAPRINTLSEGDEVQFNGEYEWNSKGGVIHWTHHDPNGNHVDGWLKHKGKMYQ